MKPNRTVKLQTLALVLPPTERLTPAQRKRWAHVLTYRKRHEKPEA